MDVLIDWYYNIVDFLGKHLADFLGLLVCVALIFVVCYTVVGLITKNTLEMSQVEQAIETNVKSDIDIIDHSDISIYVNLHRVYVTFEVEDKVLYARCSNSFNDPDPYCVIFDNENAMFVW